MKYPILALCLVGVLQAFSYECSAQAAPQGTPATVNRAALELYASATDTLVAVRYLSQKDDVVIVRQPTAKWSVIQRGKSEYYVRTQYLTPISVLNLPVDSNTGTVTYTEVVSVPGANQAELYIRGKEWFVKNFRTAAAIIQVDEKQDGVLIGKAWQDNSTFASFGWIPDSKLWYTVKITVKDGRYKYELSNFMEQARPTRFDVRPPEPLPVENYILATQKSNGGVRYTVLERQERLNVAAQALIGSVKLSMGGKVGGDW